MVTSSPEETLEYGKELGQKLAPGSVVCFEGDLGAGKTTLIKGVASGATGCSIDEVTSPTFTLLNIYEGQKPVYHFDLYRMRNSEEFISMGFDDYLEGSGICCIEWSERIADLLENPIRVRLTPKSETEREIIVEGLS